MSDYSEMVDELENQGDLDALQKAESIEENARIVMDKAESNIIIPCPACCGVGRGWDDYIYESIVPWPCEMCRWGGYVCMSCEKSEKECGCGEPLNA